MTELTFEKHLGLTNSPARLVLGGRFGEEAEEQSFRRLSMFAAAGGRYVETAHSYANGLSESVIGAWLNANPHTLRVVDKIGHPTDDGRSTLDPDSLRKQLDESLQRLGLDTIDVLLLHRDDLTIPVPVITETLLGFQESGTAQRIGFSNWDAQRLVAAVEELRQVECVPVVSYHFSLAVPARDLWPGSRHADQDLQRVARDYELPLLAWAAHARGYFTGTTESAESWETNPFDHPLNAARRSRCEEIGHERGLKPEVVALAWTLHQPHIWPIIGPRSTHELAVSLTAASVRLTDAELSYLEAGQTRD